MVILTEDTDATESTASTTTASDGENSDPENSADLTSGLLARLAERARQVADLLAPFTNLLSAIVQAATVAALVRQA